MTKRRGGWLVCPGCGGEAQKMNSDGYVCLECGGRFVVTNECVECKCGSMAIRTVNTVIMSEKTRLVNMECRVCGERWGSYEEIREYEEKLN